MRNTSYSGIDSWLDRLNPLTKIAFAGLVTYMAFFTPALLLPYILAILSIPAAIVGNVVKPFLSFVVRYMSLIAALLLLVHGMFNPADKTVAFVVGPAVFYQEGLLFALGIIGTLLVVISFFYLLTLTTHPGKLVAALVDAGLPSRAGYLVLATLQIVPQMTRRVEIIREAQQSRGMEIEGNLLVRTQAFFPLIGPLVIGSLMDLQERGMTLETRGFGAKAKVTHYLEVGDTAWERQVRRVLLWIAIGYTVLILALKVRSLIG